MQRFVMVLAAALAALALGVAWQGSVAAAARHPKLALVQRAPLEVRGTGFRPNEVVRVSTGSVRVRVRTSRLGKFVATFRTGDRCSVGRIVAVSSSGERAVLRLPPVACPVA